MKRNIWVLLALLAHWRRHPLNLAALLVGLSIATALWSGVQALNAQARQSYAEAAAAVDGPGTRTLVAPNGGMIAQSDYVKLRRAGWKVSPVLEGTIRLGEKNLRIIGVEPLTLPHGARLAGLSRGVSLEKFLTPPGIGYAAPETLRSFQLEAPPQNRTPALPQAQALPEAPPGALVVDVGVAQKLLNRPGQLTKLVVEAEGQTPLGEIVGDALRIAQPEETSDLSRLTDSFHLNLTAFALLSFLVGLFIVHAAFGLAFEQRIAAIRAIRAVGVSAGALVGAMLLELLVLTVAAGGAGLVLGYWMAEALLPNVASTLDSLYGASVSARLQLQPGWIVSGLAMALAGALSAAAGGLFRAFRLPILATRPQAWREAHRHYLRRQALLGAAAIAGALALSAFGQGLAAGFALIAGGLVGAALILPVVVDGALRLGEKCSKGPIAQWFWSDGRQQLPGLSLALMSLLIALAADIGVGGMVEGFRVSFTRWLDERLIAEVYFEARDDAAAAKIEDWLRRRPEVEAILPAWRTRTKIDPWPAEVFAMRPHQTYREHFPLLEQSEGAWDRLARGDAALISEQLARRLKLGLGDAVDVPTEAGIRRVAVVGVYADYGNPFGQLRVDAAAFERQWPHAPRINYSLRVAQEKAAGLIRDMQEEIGPLLARLVDQAYVKQLSLSIFERTFAVTAALNVLTLIISATALLFSLLTIGEMRLAQLAPVWALGVSRRRLAGLELIRALVFACAVAFCALPLGLFMSWCLVAVVNVAAFGWRLPFHAFPAQWAQIFAVALATALAAALWPAIRLARREPVDLLRVFASER
ncbi:FtsX-like permease family protein [Methylocystis heyeri]|uniref:FtsX-like permease family protein n=1 Tax=Methylocystis heyeri TaxID=391905 RepID=A0A6B8KK38_9HYPH|nr:ABC transporter permease [Methylocystis heyeri]QGM47315.1 FtsX-like permease family protein [Methylocystis heyeri]